MKSNYRELQTVYRYYLLTMRRSIQSCFIVVVVLVFIGCKKQDVAPVVQPPANNYSSAVATDWMRTIQTIVQTEGLNPPVASRVYAYAGISLYEAVVPGMSGYQSLQGQVVGLSNIPDAKPFGQLDYITAANEALYQVTLKILIAPKPDNVKAIEELHTKYYNESFRRTLSETVHNSVAFGRAVAAAVINRASNDNFAATRGLSYVVPSSTLNPSFWSPTGAALTPLEPYWGQIKCFTMAKSDACTIKSSIPFSSTQGSPFYSQANEVFVTSVNLTTDQKNIANWWSDGSVQTATPPGHWVNIIDQLSRRNKYDLGKSAELYAMVNIAMADAFISCWDEKFRMNLLRPVTYIRNYIPSAGSWTPLLATPPFPEYPSGHSVASGAAASVLTALLGNVAFVDSANTNLGYPARSFNSFTEAANEAAISRLYGGIHFREAIENGLVQGKEVSKAVFDKIKLRK
jgi:hypothetical protein